MTKRFLERVTITGVDDNTALDDLVRIHKEFPFVEFGILATKESCSGDKGKPRFPGRMWLADLADSGISDKISFSLHLCGDFVGALAVHGIGPLKSFQACSGIRRLFFRRMQVNTGGKIKFIKMRRFWPLVYILNKVEVILQMDGLNDDSIIQVVRQNLNATNPWMKEKGFSVLMDGSHGSGRRPDRWVSPENFICKTGYAGGLTPENVAEELAAMSMAGCVNKGMWIDAETGLRTGKNLDLGKVCAFLENCTGSVKRN